MEKLYESLEDKYGQKYRVTRCVCWGVVDCIQIDNEYFEIKFPENIKNKNEIMIRSYNDTLCYYNEIERLINGITRLIKKQGDDKNK